ncbi:hypothetical protein WME73_06390 [Sorangium sp. So ce302]|uniref:hypothetical protein n=1 Tax=Sorangium sp. So ce302 TaxID=3133297 RepID=UPI003F61DC84
MFHPGSATDRLAQTFANHHDYYRAVGGETLNQQLADEGAISNQYAGRAAFELLQNALDRCDKVCVVALVRENGSTRLLVANDGATVSFDPDFDYRSLSRHARLRRSDFHALCSLHTSNKTPDESIGNKGVGFRSVFALADRVQVWTRADDGFWGLELHRLLDAERLAARRIEDRRVRDGEVRFLEAPLQLDDGARWPSFYFPIPLWCASAPEAALEALPPISTVVVVPIEPGLVDQVAESLRELGEGHVHFVGLRATKKDVRVVIADGDDRNELRTSLGSQNDRLQVMGHWVAASIATSSESLAALAKAAGHPVSQPSVAVGWRRAPSASGRDAPSASGRYFCYLPTLVAQPVGVDVHADFQLKLDRTSLRCDEKKHDGRYNASLLRVTAEIHLHMVLHHLGFEEESASGWAEWRAVRQRPAIGGTIEDRDDIWQMLRPRADDPFSRELLRLLFGDNPQASEISTYRRWAELAAQFFRADVVRPRRAFDEFWQATAVWIDWICGYRRHTKSWKTMARAACDALRARRAHVIPVVDLAEANDTIYVAVVLPDHIEAGSGGGRATHRVFVRRSADEEHAATLTLPRALLDRGRAVTAYRVPLGIDDDHSRLTGMTPFERWDLLRELRQLPVDAARWQWRPLAEEDAAERQKELIVFAAQLFVARFGTQKSLQDQTYKLGWRAHHAAGSPWSEDELRAGRAVATLFLPCTEGRWAPARQLSRKEVSPEWLTALQVAVPGLDVDRFLDFLGVSPFALRLVEGGATGIVSPCASPPALVDAESVGAAPLDVVWGHGSGPTLEDIVEAWSALEPLIAAEKQAAFNGTIATTLSSAAWFPKDKCRRPDVVTSTEGTVSPRQITLASDQPDRRYAVLWTYRRSASHAEVLRALGAVPGLSDDDLMTDGAEPARRLWLELHSLNIELVGRDPKTRQGALELFQSVLDAVARKNALTDAPLPLLAYAPAERDRSFGERALEWRAASEDAWIATDNGERDRVRAFFPSVPLVAATLGPKVIQLLPWLKQRALVVEENVESVPLGAAVVRRETEVRQELEALLPGLLALAEVSRLLPSPVNAVDAAERWHATKLQHVACVSLRLSLEIPGRAAQSARWLHDTRDDVLVDDDAILFDTAPDAPGPPPLRNFAEALSARVLDNPVVGGLWSQAIAAYEDGKRRGGAGLELFRAFLKKRNAATLEDAYAQVFRPLGRDGLKALCTKVDQSLASIDTRLHTHELTIDELRALGAASLITPSGGWSETTEADVQRVIDGIEWSEDERAYRPSFACRARNVARWEEWVGRARRRDRIIELACAVEAASGAPIATPREEGVALDGFAAERAHRVGFDPVSVATEWLAQHASDPTWAQRIVDEHALDAALPRPASRYQPVLDLVGPERAVIRAHVVARRSAGEVHLKPVTPEQIAAENFARNALGGEAEDAFAPYVVSRTREVLGEHGDAAWTTLLGAVRPRTEARRRLERARADDIRLLDALHVSKFWGSAGYDLLGLDFEPTTHAPTIARYECKAVAAISALIRVFLSPNEVAVYARTRPDYVPQDQRLLGTWRLVAVEPTGCAHDLTHLIEPLVSSGSHVDKLAEIGLSADGWMLTVERTT